MEKKKENTNDAGIIKQKEWELLLRNTELSARKIMYAHVKFRHLKSTNGSRGYF